MNPIAPNVKLTWGIIENNQVNLIVDLCWCRDFLLWWLANIAKPKLPRFKERSFAIKDLLLVMRLYDSYGNIPVRDKLKNGLRYLHQIETDFGLETTKVIPVDKKEYIVIKGDPFWTKTTLHAGFWTLILRTCMHKDCPDQFTEKDICTIFNKDQAIKYDLALNVVELRYSDIFKYFPKILYNLPEGPVSGALEDNITWRHGYGLLYNMYPRKEKTSHYNQDCYRLLKQFMTEESDPNVEKI